MNIMIITIKKIKTAFKSRLEYKKDLTELQIKRLNICKGCPFNSDNKKEKTTKEKIYMILNKFLNFICRVSVTEDSVCNKCGCQIVFKSTQTDEDLLCPLGKWKNL